MIAKVLRGAGFGGLLAYLYGPGREEAHVDARIVAGCTAARDPRGVARELRAYAAQNERASRPVLHASLRVPAEEAGRLDDQGWGRVAQEWMTEMGYRAQEQDLAPWVVVRHGEDHVHIVASRIGYDGRAIPSSFERRRSHAACRTVERSHGLIAPDQRPQHGLLQTVTASERESARRRGVEPECARLRAGMEHAAQLAGSPQEFERACVQHGIRLRANVASTGRMNGYSATIDGWTDADGQPIWLPASKVHRSLTWSKLKPQLHPPDAQAGSGTSAAMDPGSRSPIPAAQPVPEPLSAADADAQDAARLARLGSPHPPGRGITPPAPGSADRAARRYTPPPGRKPGRGHGR